MNRNLALGLPGFFLFTGLVASLSSVQAEPVHLVDAAQVKALLPAGEELARAYNHRYNDETSEIEYYKLEGDSYLDAVAGSFRFADLNLDGIDDVIVISEAAPIIADGEYGQRTLRVFFGDEEGQFVQVAKNSQIALRKSDGGVFGDPLEPIVVTKKMSFKIIHYGGSSDRWGSMQVFQFRNFRGVKDIYLIGESSTQYSTLTGKGIEVDTNLLTGKRITTIQRGHEGGDRSHVSHIPVKPLVEMNDAVLN